MAYHIQVHPPIGKAGIIHYLYRRKNRQYSGTGRQHLNQGLHSIEYACRIIPLDADTRTGNNFQPIAAGNFTVVPID